MGETIINVQKTAVFVAIAALVCSHACLAVERDWIHSTGSHFYVFPINWSPAGTPTAADDVAFGPGLADLDAHLRFLSTTTLGRDMDFALGEVMLGEVGSFRVINNTGDLAIADPLESSVTEGAKVEMVFGQWTTAGDTVVGGTGAGSFSLRSDGRHASRNLSIATTGSRAGHVEVIGQGVPGTTALATTLDLTLGSAGDLSQAAVGTFVAKERGEVTIGGHVRLNHKAALSLLSGATLSSQSGTIAGGNRFDGQPEAIVSGPLSAWTMTEDLVMGDGLAAHLTISDGGQLSSRNATVGSAASLPPTTVPVSVSVSGTNSMWSTTETLTVGLRQIFEGAIVDGGQLFTGSAVLGSNTELTIAGAGSQWQNNGKLRLFSAGILNVSQDNRLKVTSGARLVTSDLIAGRTLSFAFDNGSDAGILLSGQQSELVVENELTLGDGASSLESQAGIASLVIESGGRLASQTAVLAQHLESKVTVSISGEGSAWVNDGPLLVGGAADGSTGIANVQLSSDGLLEAGGTLEVRQGSTIELAGGTLKLDSSQAVFEGALDFQSGTLHITDAAGYTLGAGSPLVESVYGAGDLLIVNNRNFVVDETLTVSGGRSLTQVAANVTAGTLINHGRLTAQDAKLGTLDELVNNVELVLIDSTVGGPVTNNPGSTVTAVGDVTFLGPVSGSGNFFGPGQITFSGGLSPGASPATIEFEGSVQLASSNALLIELGGLTAGSEHDAVNVAGPASLAGNLEVSLLEGFTPSAGDTFEILTAASVVDEFDTTNFPELAGLAWNVEYNPTSVILSLTTAILFGDADNNLTVSGSDLLAVTNNFGNTGPADGLLLGDADDNGTVSGSDLLAVTNNFGATLPSALASSPVPEPASAGLLGLFCFVAVLLGRKHRRHPST